MSIPRLFALTLLAGAVLLWILPSAALADRIGSPYRGPSEMVQGTGTSAEEEAPATDEGSNEGEGGEGGEEGDPTGETAAPPDVNPQGVDRGKVAPTDGSALWQWWWEHNKDRYLARLTAPGRVKAGSAYYWFGAGAKYPPREVVPVSETQRRESILKALQEVLAGRNPPEVKVEACIALGRLGQVPATKEQVKKDEPNNLVVRELIGVIKRSQQAPVLRQNAILGLGMTRDADGCQFLFRNLTRWTAEDRPYVFLAFGLARYAPAIQLLLAELPKSNREATDSYAAAIHALGLYGPEAVEEMNAENREGIERLARLADIRGADEIIASQAVAALGRLQQEIGTVRKALRAKSPAVVRSAILALANYGADEKDAETAYKALSGVKNPRQEKVFATLALGDLAGRLDPNSKTRGKILNFLREKAAERKSNYVRSSAALALGLADDRTSIDAVAALLRDTTAVDYVLAAACLSLGLLRDTEHADLIRSAVIDNTRWQADTRGYGILGLALMGDTTRVGEILKHARGTPREQTERQLTLAIGVLGGRDQVPTLVDYFAKDWIQKREHAVSNAAFGLCWNHDESAVEKLVDLVRKSPDPKVRGLAVVALGYVGARDRVNPLSRCYENMNHNNRFAHWSVLHDIATIL